MSKRNAPAIVATPEVAPVADSTPEVAPVAPEVAPVADVAPETVATPEVAPVATPEVAPATGGSLTKPLDDANLELVAATLEVARATKRRDDHMTRAAGVHPHTLRWLAIATKRLANATARVAALAPEVAPVATPEVDATPEVAAD